ncbi:outer membrane protein [Hoeflea poritis]|uniref:Outer membrane beta-barrel protein n=1 Tax=Hoeflea poritis TaxID=2993659 RepID=A0ABT4VMT3_9HYPH|nr:outer membrane beta-barrel protein [Hoeflea poritis]MDA4846032.1 outer membrane beta-barrel protein [Hoeflea poritis]
MRYAVSGAVLAFALSAPAMAADVIVEQPQSIVSGTSVYDWSGFWVGAGGGRGAVVHELGLIGFPVSFNGVGGDGFFGQLSAGYDHVFDNGLVAGIAVSGRYGNIETTLDIAPVPFFGFPGFNADVTAEYGFDVIGRLGYTVAPRTLAYVLGGYTWQHFDISTNFTGSIYDWSSSGYVVGLGVEHAVRDKWTVRSEYRYSHYSSHDVAGAGFLSIDPSTHTFHTTLNYRFNGGDSARTIAPLSYDWTGIKLGVAGGAGAIVHDVDLIGSFIEFNGIGGEGVLGEINIGYDREFGNGYLGGVVLAARVSNIETSLNVGGFNADIQADYGFDALLRVGKIFGGRTLAYAIGGYTWQSFDLSSSPAFVTGDWDLGGFTIGTGAEFAITERITAYTEYRYTYYEDTEFNSGGFISLKPSTHTVRAGAKFKLY